MSDDTPLDAGTFSEWLAGMQAALRGDAESTVPCDGCTACCTSSQFVHIGPDEIETLARIPAELLFPAPGSTGGDVVLGYDEHGRCPMLVDDACTIYEHRPRACRTYDCRIFPATGVEVDATAQPAIAARTRRWRFEHPTELDRVQHDALVAAAGDVRGRREPVNPTEHAVLAVRLQLRASG